MGSAGLEELPRAQGAADSSDLRQIPVDCIEVPQRPARRFLGDIAALAESMQEYGLQQPISVRVDGDRLILTSGMRRLAAARLLRWSTIPGWVRSLNADEAYLIDLIENLQREDLSPEEEADAFGELIRTRGWTLQQVADSVKRSVGYVSKRVRVFEDAHLRQAIAERGLPVSTAEELLAAAPEQRSAVIELAVVQRWDQVRARDVLRPPELLTGRAAGAADRPVPLAERRHPADADDHLSADVSQSFGVARPKGFTRAVREFHRIVNSLNAQDLTPADRGALRALFRDLVLLARSPSPCVAHVFPPLPTVPTTSQGVANAAPRRRLASDASTRGRPRKSARS